MIVKNTTDSPRDLHIPGVNPPKVYKIPAATNEPTGGGGSQRRPGSCDVPDDELAIALSDDVVAAWFSDGPHGGLRVEGKLPTAKKPAAPAPAPAKETKPAATDAAKP